MLKIVYIGNKLSGSGYTPTTIDVLAPEFDKLGFEVIASSAKVNKIARMVDMLSTIAGNRDADVVLIDTYSTSAFYFSYTCAQLCRLLKIKYIPILHGGDLPSRFKKSPGLSKSLFGKSYTNIAVSPYLQELLKKNNLREVLIENVIELENYRFKQKDTIAPNFIWVRSFDKIYNPEMAIQVFNNILDEYPTAKLIMVGPDRDGSMQTCKTLVAQLQLEGSISFTGKLSKNEWHALAANYDIFINTSSYDNMPVSIIEAMALGLVVVSTNAGGLPYFLKHTKNALLSDIDDVRSMTVNIEALLSGKYQSAILSIEARKEAEKYDWQLVKEKWMQLFNSLVSEK